MHNKHLRDSVILGSARTPLGKFLGGLAPLTAAELGQIAVKAALSRSGIDSNKIDEVIIGRALFLEKFSVQEAVATAAA